MKSDEREGVGMRRDKCGQRERERARCFVREGMETEKHTGRDTETHRQAERRSERERDTHTHRQKHRDRPRDRQTHREAEIDGHTD